LRDAENAAGTDDLAAPSANRADLGRRALFGAAAVARFALAQFGDVDFFLAPLGGLQESQFHVVAQIVAALGAAGAPFAAAEKVLEDAGAAEDFAEDVARIVEAGAAAAGAGAGVESGVAVLIVGGACLRIA